MRIAKSSIIKQRIIMKKEFIRVRSAKDIVITFLLIIAGSVCVALSTAQSINVLGFFLIFAGVLLLFILKTGYKDLSTGVAFAKVEKYFAQSLKDEIHRQIRSGKVDIDLSAEDKGNGLRLDLYHSKKAGKAYIQIFEYIPYKYEPCSDIHEFELEQIKYLL